MTNKAREEIVGEMERVENTLQLVLLPILHTKSKKPRTTRAK